MKPRMNKGKHSDIMTTWNFKVIYMIMLDCLHFKSFGYIVNGFYPLSTFYLCIAGNLSIHTKISN